MNIEPTIASAAAGLVYAFIGYARQQKDFDSKRFFITAGLSVVIGSGMAIAGISPSDPLTAGAVSIAAGSVLKKGLQYLWKIHKERR